MDAATLTWLLVMAFLAGTVASGVWLLWRRPGAEPVPALPAEWPLTPRGIFNKEERRLHRVLREALPHHLILPKLPLIRFCQPVDPGSVNYWYELLGATHVSFAICTVQGRVIAALDLDGRRPPSRRADQIKRQVLAACQVPCLRCPAGKLPTAAELQGLVPPTSGGARGPQAAPPRDERDIDEVRDSLSQAVATRRAERSALWQDSAVFQDSFFLIDDVRLPGSGHGHAATGEGSPTDIVGIVIDQPRGRAARASQGRAG